ncbi:MAG TPA: signal peptide peptidase SppA [Anaeromyxobacter sp.]|nr:signal peptide peptidase SppA [Anaeromyxobacter sp.]
MNPSDPGEPLPTTPAAPPAGPEPQWAGPSSWGEPPRGAQPPALPPPPPPRRDRLALAIVAFVFGGLFLVFFGFLFLAASAVRGESPKLGGGPRIGVVEIKGTIGPGAGGVDAATVMKQLRRFGNDDSLKAVVVRIESPGGAVGTSQEIHEEVKRLASKKPVVCSMGDLAASGGFYIAVACPKIVATPGTLTGSIGVISQFANLKGLAQRFDVKMETVKSGALKDAGNPFRDMTPEDRAYWQALIDKVYQQFLQAVADGRHLKVEQVRPIADGRVLTGQEAKERGLVDALGNLYDAVDMAKGEAKLTGEPVLVYPPEDKARLLEQLMGGVVGQVADAVRARIAREAAEVQQPGVYFLAR